MTRYQVDSSWWRRANSEGDTVMAGSPLKVFRFATAARPVLESLETGSEVSTVAHSVVDRLLDAGAIHPILESLSTSLTSDDVTVVIPAHNEDSLRLELLVAQLSATHEVIIVDDGSSTPIGDIDGARVIRREVAGGPAAARNTALSSITSSIVFFLDADAQLENDWSWITLLTHFDNRRVGVVAPRIVSAEGSSLMQRYERAESPLDLGVEPAKIRQNSRVSYVPTAAALIRTALLHEHDGFDESFRYGEDVDFIWRVLDANIICRYEPAVIVFHQPRATFLAAWQQRVSYGSAAAPLDRRHRGAATPLRINRWSALAWSALAIGHPIIGVLIAGGSTAALKKKIGSSTDSWPLALRVAGRGNLYAGRMIAQALTRTWWPIALVLSLTSRRGRGLVGAAVLLPSLWSWFTKKPKVSPVAYVALKLADDVAYGTGVWKGVIASREIGALTPHID